MKPSIDAGKLRDTLQVLELKESPAGTWMWQSVRNARGQVELSTKSSLFSAVGIGARGAEIMLRRQPLTLHNALLWGKQHLFLTSILPEGRLYLRVQAALVELSSLSAYLVYFRQRYTLVLQLGGGLYTMLAESLMILAALVWAAWSLAEELNMRKGRP